MAKKMFFVGMLGAALAVLIGGCKTEADGGGGGGFDSALVGTWHSTQAAADSGENVAFEFTADGILTGDAFTAGEVRVTTSGRRISATLYLDGQAPVDAGSADYDVDGTELRFSNPSAGQPNYFTILITALNAVSGFPGASDCYFKRAGSGGGGDDDGKNGGKTFDSNLVGMWYWTQAAANNGDFPAFEFTSDGKLTSDHELMMGETTVTTLNGHITTTNGSVDYEINGTELRFFNPSSGFNTFSSLIGRFYKAGSGGGASFDSTLVGTWYSSWADANNGQNAVFEFTTAGRLLILNEEFMTVPGELTATTSSGRIHATLAVNREKSDAGAANYEFSDNGNQLEFSNMNMNFGLNYFTLLVSASGDGFGRVFFTKGQSK
jgi:hypothetical protein